MSHTKEPWLDDDRGHGVITGFDGKTTAMSNKTIATANSPKDSRRIVACVNACAGLPTDMLEKASGMLESVADLAKQRDELLAALEAAAAWGAPMAEAPKSSRPDWFDKARAAIASVKGGAV